MSAPDGVAGSVERLIAVLEGAARDAAAAGDAGGLEVVRAERDGDAAIVALAEGLTIGGGLLVVTADRGLRQRLPPTAKVAAPNWLNGLIGR